MNLADFKGKHNHGFIYLIESDGYHKVGLTTSSLKQRISSIQTSNPRLVTLIDSFETESTVFDEKCLHKFLKKYQVLREWFEIPQDLIDNRQSWFKSYYAEQAPGYIELTAGTQQSKGFGSKPQAKSNSSAGDIISSKKKEPKTFSSLKTPKDLPLDDSVKFERNAHNASIPHIDLTSPEYWRSDLNDEQKERLERFKKLDPRTQAEMYFDALDKQTKQIEQDYMKRFDVMIDCCIQEGDYIINVYREIGKQAWTESLRNYFEEQIKLRRHQGN